MQSSRCRGFVLLRKITSIIVVFAAFQPLGAHADPGEERPAPIVTEKNTTDTDDTPEPPSEVSPAAPYLKIHRDPGNTKVLPGATELHRSYVTNTGNLTWQGRIYDDFITNPLYITLNDPNATSGTITKERTHLRWNGTIRAGETLMISYQIGVSPDTPPKTTFKSTLYSGDIAVVPNNCTWDYHTICQRTSTVELPPNIQVRRSPGNTTVVPGTTETHYIYFTNTGGVSWSGFIDEELSGYQNVTVSRIQADGSRVTRPHESYIRWKGTIAVGQTITIRYQTTVQETAAHGSVFKARFYTGLNDVGNNCSRDIGGCERSTTVVVPARFEVSRRATG